MAQRRRLLYIMNVPSPYRWYLFETLNSLGQRYAIDLQVAFLDRQDHYARWRLEDFSGHFAYTQPWGINMSRSRTARLNPGFILQVLSQPWDWVIFGGYDNPTNAALLSMPLPRTRIKVIRNEGNLNVPSRRTGWSAKLKRFLLQRCQAYLVPGQRALEWLDCWVPERGRRPVHIFPNVIDNIGLQRVVAERRVNREQLREQLNLPANKRIWFSPARLSPEKGLVEFLRQLPNDFETSTLWLIAGAGPLQGVLEEEIRNRHLEAAIKLLGFANYRQVLDLYAISDILVLPSFSDPNPLAVIEASFAGLPLLVSRRVGNAPELLKDTITGWGFDPSRQDEVRQAVRQAMAIDDDRLTAMSLAIKQQAEAFFDAETVCERLIAFLREIHPGGA